MADHRSVPPSAPPADFCPSSPPPSYAASPTALNGSDDDDTHRQQQQQQQNAAKYFLPSCKNAKNGSDRKETAQPTSAAVVVPVANDKVTIVCLGHCSQSCLSDRFAVFQSFSGRRPKNKMRKLLAFGCCAFSIAIFGLFAFAVAFLFVVLVDSQMSESDTFDQYQMRVFGHHFG